MSIHITEKFYNIKRNRTSTTQHTILFSNIRDHKIQIIECRLWIYLINFQGAKKWKIGGQPFLIVLKIHFRNLKSHSLWTSLPSKPVMWSAAEILNEHNVTRVNHPRRQEEAAGWRKVTCSRRRKVTYSRRREGQWSSRRWCQKRGPSVEPPEVVAVNFQSAVAVGPHPGRGCVVVAFERRRGIPSKLCPPSLITHRVL